MEQPQPPPPFALLNGDSLFYLVRLILREVGQEQTGWFLRVLLRDRALRPSVVNCCAKLHKEFGWGVTDLGEKRRRLEYHSESVVRLLLDFGRPVCVFCGRREKGVAPLLGSSRTELAGCNACWVQHRGAVLLNCKTPHDDCDAAACLACGPWLLVPCDDREKAMDRTKHARLAAVMERLRSHCAKGEPATLVNYAVKAFVTAVGFYVHRFLIGAIDEERLLRESFEICSRNDLRVNGVPVRHWDGLEVDGEALRIGPPKWKKAVFATSSFIATE